MLDLRSVKNKSPHSCHHLPKVSALSKQSEQDHSHGGDTDSQGITALSAHLPVDVLDDLYKIAGS